MVSSVRSIQPGQASSLVLDARYTALWFGALVLLLPLFVANGYYQSLFVVWGCYVIAVSGLNIVTGYAGQVSLGHAGLFAVGAYTTALLNADGGVSFWVSVPIAACFTAFIGLLLGFPALRVVGPYLALVTIAFNFLIEKIVLAGGNFTGAAGGKYGLKQPLMAGTGDYRYSGYYLLVAVLAALTLWGCHRLVNSRWGRAWNGLRNDHQVAEICGVNVSAAKLLAFVISAFLAGLGGALLAHYQGLVNIEQFGIGESLMLLLMLLVGGQRTIAGPVVGAAIMVALPMILGGVEQWRTFINGALLVLLVIFMPRGVLGLFVTAQDQPQSPPTDTADVAAIKLGHHSDLDTPLRVNNVSKRFGGVITAHALELKVQPRTVHSLIGPNGAGKSTLVNMISGVIKPDEGEIRFNNVRIDHLPPHEIVELGLARIFQNVRVFKDMTCLDNVLVGAHCRLRSGLFTSLARTSAQSLEEQQAYSKAMALLRLLNLEHKAHVVAGDMAYGDQHMLEIARALMSDPDILFLDEPAAGLTTEEVERLAAVIRTIKANGITIFLIEHYVEFVMDISDTVTVLDFGRKIAEGRPDQVRNDPAVIRAYLGGEA